MLKTNDKPLGFKTFPLSSYIIISIIIHIYIYIYVHSIYIYIVYIYKYYIIYILHIVYVQWLPLMSLQSSEISTHRWWQLRRSPQPAWRSVGGITGPSKQNRRTGSAANLRISPRISSLITGVGKCPIKWEYWTSPNSSHLVDHIPIMAGWCSMGTFNDPWINEDKDWTLIQINVVWRLNIDQMIKNINESIWFFKKMGKAPNKNLVSSPC